MVVSTIFSGENSKASQNLLVEHIFQAHVTRIEWHFEWIMYSLFQRFHISAASAVHTLPIENILCLHNSIIALNNLSGNESNWPWIDGIDNGLLEIIALITFNLAIVDKRLHRFSILLVKISLILTICHFYCVHEWKDSFCIFLLLFYGFIHHIFWILLDLNYRCIFEWQNVNSEWSMIIFKYI